MRKAMTTQLACECPSAVIMVTYLQDKLEIGLIKQKDEI